MGNCINLQILIRNRELYNNLDSHVDIPGNIVFLNSITSAIFNAATIVYAKNEDTIKKKQNKYCIQKTVLTDNYDKLSNDLKLLIDNAYETMTSNGFNCNKNKVFIEFQEYNLTEYTNKYSIFTWHCDDKAAHNFNCNTMIIYLYKDKRMNGGNFLYYHDGRHRKIMIENNTIIMSSGTIKHSPEDLSGIGQRKSIVIQFERI